MFQKPLVLVLLVSFAIVPAAASATLEAPVPGELPVKTSIQNASLRLPDGTCLGSFEVTQHFPEGLPPDSYERAKLRVFVNPDCSLRVESEAVPLETVGISTVYRTYYVAKKAEEGDWTGMNIQTIGKYWWTTADATSVVNSGFDGSSSCSANGYWSAYCSRGLTWGSSTSTLSVEVDGTNGVFGWYINDLRSSVTGYPNGGIVSNECSVGTYSTRSTGMYFNCDAWYY